MQRRIPRIVLGLALVGALVPLMGSDCDSGYYSGFDYGFGLPSFGGYDYYESGYEENYYYDSGGYGFDGGYYYDDYYDDDYYDDYYDDDWWWKKKN